MQSSLEHRNNLNNNIISGTHLGAGDSDAPLFPPYR